MAVVDRPSEEIRQFIVRLLAATNDGKLEWEVGGQAESFTVATRSGSVLISSNGGKHPFTFEILNEAFEPVVRFSTLPGDFYETWEEELERLYESARASALDVPGVLARLADDLDLPPAPPPKPASVSDDDIPF